MAVWQRSGRSTLRQGGRDILLAAGQWTSLNAARDFEIQWASDAECLMLQVPTSYDTVTLNLLMNAAATQGPALIAQEILLALLGEAMPLDAKLDAKSEASIGESVFALMRQALDAELATRGLSAQPGAGIQLSQVQAYMIDRVADHALTIERVAEAFGMSRRSLYKVFAPTGDTPRAFIQKAKLDRACALLAHPNTRSEPLSRIARQCGFSDPAHFTRAFHARHGQAPSAWRSQQA